eukprot:CAMPEP_0202913954 /NCGR_PEP_ID=MMETSP1392-20130828/61888_1 /ASSEMBLY_ACC=CAM_ASM_000868 /TAXON_ID=225041 /ORGANISM="Chlamydomonas chlamydogama, Strain SAG 11-48b" /LENGTH=154 /DNA_ID=CAMNT_0049605423 /DNA_START=134 /DNA_END=595 /DNA_ORIENTATION=+
MSQSEKCTTYIASILVLTIALQLLDAVQSVEQHPTAASSSVRAKHEFDAYWVKNLPAESSYMVPRRQREFGMLYRGAMERTRIAVNKLVTGQPFRVGFVGASCTEGIGYEPGQHWQLWTNRVCDMLRRVFTQSNITQYNGAKGGTNTEYMALCV